MGISGRISQIFLHSQMTPLIALVALLLGVFAVLVTPREEEPQINVTMANVLIPFPGASAQDVEQLVTDAGRAGAVADHRGGACLLGVPTGHGGDHRAVQGRRGSHPGAGAPVRHHQLEHATGCSPTLGVGDPIIKPKGIDDVPIVAPDAVDRRSGARRVSSWSRSRMRPRSELKRVPGDARWRPLGGAQRAVRVLLDTERLNAMASDSEDVRDALHRRQCGDARGQPGGRQSRNPDRDRSNF